MSNKKRLRPASARKSTHPKNFAANLPQTSAPIPAATPTAHPAAEPAPVASPAVAIAALEEALAAVRDLSSQRLRAKLSASRLMGVARELRELLKVMSVYGV